MKTFLRKDSWDERDYCGTCSYPIHNYINQTRLILEQKKNT